MDSHSTGIPKVNATVNLRTEYMNNLQKRKTLPAEFYGNLSNGNDLSNKRFKEGEYSMYGEKSAIDPSFLQLISQNNNNVNLNNAVMDPKYHVNNNSNNNMYNSLYPFGNMSSMGYKQDLQNQSPLSLATPNQINNNNYNGNNAIGTPTANSPAIDGTKKKRGRPRIHPLPDPKLQIEKKLKAEKKKLMPLEKAISNILKQLMKSDINMIFYHPVKDSIAPGYSKIIKYPMCFSKIKERLNSKRYPTLAHAKRDFLLVFENCKQYNQDDTIYFTEAVRLQEDTEKLVIQFKEKLAEEEIGDLLNLPPPGEYTSKQKTPKGQPTSPKKPSTPSTPLSREASSSRLNIKSITSPDSTAPSPIVTPKSQLSPDTPVDKNRTPNSVDYRNARPAGYPMSDPYRNNDFRAPPNDSHDEIYIKSLNYLSELTDNKPVKEQDLRELQSLNSHGIDLSFLGLSFS